MTDRAAYQIAWRAANKDKTAEYDRRWRARHPEATRARSARYYAAHREEQMAGMRAHYALSPTVVYAWIAPGGAVDYVGRGTLHRAYKVTGRQREWWTPEHMVLSMTCDSEWQAMELEGQWGARLQPRHNKEGYRHANQ